MLKYEIPEPVRLADSRSRKMIKQMGKQDYDNAKSYDMHFISPWVRYSFYWPILNIIVQYKKLQIIHLLLIVFFVLISYSLLFYSRLSYRNSMTSQGDILF